MRIDGIPHGFALEDSLGFERAIFAHFLKTFYRIERSVRGQDRVGMVADAIVRKGFWVDDVEAGANGFGPIARRRKSRRGR